MYSGETQNYKLPQYEEQDTFDPVADWNPAFETIDGELYKTEQYKVLFNQLVTSAEESAKKAAQSADNADVAAKRAENIASGAVDKEEALAADFNRLKERVEYLEAALFSLTKRVNSLEEE